MADLGELRRRRRADPAVGRIRPHQVREARLDRVVALAQRVVVGIRDGRRILLVVALVVLGDLGGEPLELGLGLGGRQRVGGNARRSLGVIGCGRFEGAGLSGNGTSATYLV